jgi:hypothetical protein
MMKSVLALTFAALMTCGLTAQIGGSINKDAPKVTNAIEMGKNKLEVSYTAIRFGKGSWQKIKENTERHDGFNKFAANTPVGHVKTTCDLVAAGKAIPAGDYSMYFTVSERAGWILNLKPAEGDAIMWRMHLTDTAHKSACLKVSLEPSEKSGVCSIAITFGEQAVTVPVSTAAAKKEEK